MDKPKFQVTQEGLAELQKEYDNLVHVVRQEVIRDLQAARAQGDLSENADYDAARDRQGHVEARIRELDAMLQNIEIIGDDAQSKGNDHIHLNSVVTIKELDTNEVETYTIVGSVESDPLAGKLSNETPLAAALLQHHVGDICQVLVDEPYEVEVLDIK